MPTRRDRNGSTTRMLGEIAVAVPQVVAQRLTRMAIAGPVLSARDKKEFSGMVREKQQAFVSSWMSMFSEAARIQQSLASTWLMPSKLLNPWSAAQSLSQASQAQGWALRVAKKGLTPIHKKAVSNAKRLSKAKLR